MACTINPFVAYIDLLIAAHTANPGNSYDKLMEVTFSFVSIEPNNELCFGDCGNFAFLGPILDSSFNSNLKTCYDMLNINFPLQCCENYDISSIQLFTDLNLPSLSMLYNSELCCNSFNTCAPIFNNLMQEYFGKEDQYTPGIHEYGTFNGNSSLCLINDKIQGFSDTDKTDFLNGFYKYKGFVVYNNGLGQTWVGTTSGFLSWY